MHSCQIAHESDLDNHTQVPEVEHLSIQHAVASAIGTIGWVGALVKGRTNIPEHKLGLLPAPDSILFQNEAPSDTVGVTK